MKCLSPSVLSADFAMLGEQVRLLDEAGAEYVHIDVMDGWFVPSITFGFPIMKSIRPYTKRVFDVHLMINEPIRYIDEFADAGADIITVHAEACIQLDRTIAAIKARGLKASVALKPETPIRAIRHLLPMVDMVLIMTVNPGFGGQKMMPYTVDKVKELKRVLDEEELDVDIEVDGGINFENVESILDAGANVIVSGSAIFKGDIRGNVTRFLDIIHKDGRDEK